MSEKIIVLHPENQPEVDIYPIIKEGSIPNSVIDNQKIKSRTIINSNIALNTLKYEVLHQTLKDLIDSKITQVNMQNYLSSYYYNVEETQQYVGSEINTLHQTIQNEFYSKTTIDDMLMEKTDLSLFRQYLSGSHLSLVKGSEAQAKSIIVDADSGSINVSNLGNINNNATYYFPNSIVKTEDAQNGYYVLSTTNDDYQSLYNLGAYDKITTNDDGTYTITRKTGYVDLGTLNWSVQQTSANYRFIAPLYQLVYGTSNVLCSKYSYVGGDATWNGVVGISTDANASIIQICDTSYADATAFKNAMRGVFLQYELSTTYTEKIEKNHYATYNQRFILEHNKSEAERSSNLWKGGNLSYIVEYDGYQVFDVSNIDALVGDTITIKFKSNTYNDVLKFLPAIGKDGYVSNINGVYTLTFILTSGSNKLFYISGHVSENISFYDIQVNKGSVALPYQPYEGKTIHEKDLGNYTNIYNVSKLYQHYYKLEAIPSNDTIYVTCWSTKSDKILLKDITRYAFSNVQVYNSSNDETIQVIKWASSGFRYINDSGNIDSNGYTVTNYYINGEPTIY